MAQIIAARSAASPIAPSASNCRDERPTPQLVAAALMLSGLVAACSAQNLSTEGAGATVAPDSDSALAIDQPIYLPPVYVQRYPCSGAQAKCWGAPSW